MNDARKTSTLNLDDATRKGLRLFAAEHGLRGMSTVITTILDRFKDESGELDRRKIQSFLDGKSGELK